MFFWGGGKGSNQAFLDLAAYFRPNGRKVTELHSKLTSFKEGNSALVLRLASGEPLPGGDCDPSEAHLSDDDEEESP